MPRKPKETMQNCEKIEIALEHKIYNRDYYKKNRDLIAAKYKQIKQELLYEQVKNWKEEKLKDPNAFSPFYNS